MDGSDLRKDDFQRTTQSPISFLGKMYIYIYIYTLFYIYIYTHIMYIIYHIYIIYPLYVLPELVSLAETGMPHNSSSNEGKG